MEGNLGEERKPDESRSDIAANPQGDCPPQGGCRPEHSHTEPIGAQGLFGSRIGTVPWSLWDVVNASVLFLPIGVAGSLVLGLVLARTVFVADKTLAVVLGSTLLPIALIGGAWIFGPLRHKSSSDSLGFRRTSLWAASWLPTVTLAIGLSVTAVYALLVEALGIDILVPDQNLEEIAALDGIARAQTFAIVGVLAPFAEEVFFRGFLLAALVPKIGGLRGAVVSSSVFSAAHLNVGTLFPIFVMGMLLAWLYLRTGSIWPPVAAHAAQNLLALIFLEIPIDAPTAILQA